MYLQGFQEVDSKLFHSTHLLYKDIMELKQMMEKLGQAKPHLELKKMIAEIDTDDSGTINYTEFLNMMLGKKNSILKM